MEKEFSEITKLFKEAKSVDSKTLKVDQEFSELLREKLYENYLNQVSQGGFIMSKLKAIFSNRKYALLSVGVIALLAILVGGGVILFKGDDLQEEESREVLLAANLAVADGEVELMKSGEDRWMEAKQGDVLNEGDSLKTGKESRAVLELDNGDAVRLNAASEVKLGSMDPESVVLSQVSGESYARVASSDQNTFAIEGQGVTAQALGTAYKFSSNEEKKQVQVYVYESDVKVDFNEEEKEVKELKKAIIDTEGKKVEVKDMSEEEYNDKFAEWNRDQDKDLGYVYSETGPSVTISEPEDGTKTKDDKVAVKGTVSKAESGYDLRKIKVNGEIYTEMKDGKGFDPATGEFNVNVELAYGENTIKVVAYDMHWNAGKAASVKVTREGEPAPSSSFYISNIYSPGAGKIAVSWVNHLGASDGYKLVYAKSPTVPEYPTKDGSQYKYLDGTSTTITGLQAGTYNVRVCIYHPNDGVKCPTYTPMKTITIEGEVKGATNYATGINLSAVALGSGKAKMTWTISGGEAPDGFKLAWAKKTTSTTPNYFGANDGKTYQSSSGLRKYDISELEVGKEYYFGICVYKGNGVCGVYDSFGPVTIN